MLNVEDFYPLWVCVKAFASTTGNGFVSAVGIWEDFCNYFASQWCPKTISHTANYSSELNNIDRHTKRLLQLNKLLIYYNKKKNL